MLCTLLLTSVLAFGGESEDVVVVLCSRVYPLKHITSEQARDLFSQLNIGKSYNMLTSDVLIVTSDVGADLVRATEIINVLDQTPPVRIRTLMTASESELLLLLDEFFATLGTISAGTMTEAPPKGADRPAIIDVLGDKLIAIAAEDVLADIETAINDWKKEHPASTSKDQAVPASSVVQIPETPQEESAVMAAMSEMAEKPEETAEPNVPELAPEPNKLTETTPEMTISVEPVIAEEPALAPVATALQPSAETPLIEVDQQLFESPPATDANEPSAEAATEHAETAAEPNEPADTEPQEETEEDFLNEGLLEVLADAEEKAATVEDKASVEPVPEEVVAVETVEEAKPEQTEDMPKTAAAAEPVQKTEEKDDPMKIMRALLAQAKAEEEQALTAQKAAEEAELKQAPSPEAKTIQTAEPVEEAATLQDELKLLRQRLAELEAKAGQKEKPAPADIVESKVQTAESVRTEPQIESQLAEKELDTTVIDLPQEVELEALIDLVGKQFGLNYYYDPAILKGQKVKLKVQGKITVGETYKLLESVLRQKGFVMTRRGRLVTIIKTVDANQAAKLGDTVIREPDDPIPPGTLIVRTKFTLHHISTTSAKSMLMQLQLGLQNGFQEIPETNTLIVTDYTYRMDQIRQVLDMIDVPGEKKEYKLRTLKYMKPSEMVPKLEKLAGQLQDVSLQISTPAAAAKMREVKTRDPRTGRTITKRVPVTTSTPAASQKAQADAVFIDTDDRTNRILMVGKTDQIELINELIDVLDVPQYDLKIVREYIIQNVEASEVIDVLNELALASVTVSTQQTTPTPSRTRQPARTPTPQPAAKAADGSEQPYISVRPATNSLLVNATA